MLKHDDEVKRIVNEREIEIRLKKYFKYLDNVVGEDYASLVLASNSSLTESLKMFTKKFDDISDNDIIFALLRSSVISKDVNSNINLIVKSYLENGDFEELFDLIRDNYSIRKQLTRNFIRDSYSSNYQIYNKKEDNDNTLGNVLSLKYYQMSLDYNK